MRFFKKLQKLDVFWRKVLVFLVIIGVGIPLSFFTVKNFQKRVKEFDKEKFLENVNLSEIKQGMENLPFEELEETKQKLEKELEKLGEMAEQMTTSTTSTE